MNHLISNIWIPILSAILAFLGAIAGSYVSADKAEDLWQKQEHTVQLKAILDKRVELVERVSKLSNLTKKYAVYQSYADLQAQLAREFLLCKQSAHDDCIAPDGAKEVTEITLKRVDLNSEFASTLQLVSLYFYCDAKESANELGGVSQWWLVENRNLFTQLISAMLVEISNPDIKSCSFN